MSELPSHIGIILDGNRRWAKAQGLKSLEGHRRGSEVFKEISLGMFERGVKYVSAYVFSTENWHRKVDEVDYLMRLVIKAVELHLDEYHKRNIRIRILGARDKLHQKVIKAIERTEEKTAGNNGGELALCFNYGGRQELVDATKKLIASGTSPNEVTEEMISAQLYAPEIPDLDLIIRTSGEQRLSGFMLWRSWYAELEFIQKHWPEVTLEDIDEILKRFKDRERRFGC